MIGARGIATLAGIGYLRPAPGTWGSLAALPLAWGLHEIGGVWLLAAATLCVGVLGYFAIAAVTRDSAEADRPEIVVDELVGQWIALLPVSYGALFADVAFTALWPGILTAFLAFRLFDIWKPGPVGYVDRMEGPLPVLLDDVVAGWLAAMLVAVAAVLAHLPVIL